MISFELTFSGILLGTLLPVYLALFLTSLIGKRISSNQRMRYFTAIGLGILLFFFIDVTLDSTELGVNSGLSGGLAQGGLLLSFAAGALVLTITDYYLCSSAASLKGELGTSSTSGLQGEFSKSSSRAVMFLIPALIALGLGIHGAGEGSSFAYVAAFTNSTSLIDAFGGYGPIISYVSHKFLEATVIGTAYFAYVIFGERNSTEQTTGLQASLRRQLFELLTLGFLIWIPTILGTAIGYFLPVDPIYFYAFASGATIYSILRLASPTLGPVFESNNGSLFSRTNVLVLILILIGFFLLYFAALLHST